MYHQTWLQTIFQYLLRTSAFSSDRIKPKNWSLPQIFSNEKLTTRSTKNYQETKEEQTQDEIFICINGIHHFGDRETSYRMVIHEAVSSSIYQNDDGDIIAIVWNPTNEKQTITFITPTGEQIIKSVNANTLTTIDL